MISPLQRRYYYWALLVSHILALTLTPFFEGQFRLINGFIVASVVLSILAIPGPVRWRIIGFLLGILPVGLVVVSAATDKTWMDVLFFASASVFFLYVIVHFTRKVFLSRRVDTNTLLAAINVYFMMALLWAMVYGLMGALLPNAYNVPLPFNMNRGIYDLLYFSVVTLTTLGYGDIVPTAAQTKALAAMEALIGQMYLTVMVARLVGLHINTHPKRLVTGQPEHPPDATHHP